MEKGIETKQKILDIAVKMVREKGLDSLTIGEIAKKVQMSKSGVFSHFESRDYLLVKVIEFAAQDFKLKVFDRSILAKRGLARLQALSDNWIKWDDEPNGACPIMSASFEFDDRPGIVREIVAKFQTQVVQIWERAAEIAVSEKEFLSNTDCKQFAYEAYANVLSYNVHRRLLQDKKALQKYKQTFQNLLNKYKR